jgi:hypothetical protein
MMTRQPQHTSITPRTRSQPALAGTIKQCCMWVALAHKPPLTLRRYRTCQSHIDIATACTAGGSNATAAAARAAADNHSHSAAGAAFCPAVLATRCTACCRQAGNLQQVWAWYMPSALVSLAWRVEAAGSHVLLVLSSCLRAAGHEHSVTKAKRAHMLVLDMRITSAAVLWVQHMHSHIHYRTRAMRA